jgi:hypothetical protein
MKRAAVFIGVDNTGGLTQLNDAARSARRMAEEWAKEQGISPVKLWLSRPQPPPATPPPGLAGPGPA